jgi:hypothetical protein
MSVAEPRERDVNYTLAIVFGLRWEGVSEEKIAKKLLFDSVEDMHIQLENWKLPDWLIGVKSNSGKKRGHEKSTPARLRNFGPPKELPPAGNATGLFKERLEALLKSAELLKHMDEGLHGRHFVRQDVDTVGVLLPRELLSEEMRKALSERYDHDPDDEHFFDAAAVVKLPGGVALLPTETEAILIGVYALADGDMDRLLDVLHPDSSSVGAETREEIRQCIEGSRPDDKKDGLKVLARQLATWVRGSEVRTGRPSGRSKADHAFACAITHYRKRGLSDEEIARKESHRTKEDGTSYTIKDIAELGDLGLSWP